jgi:hypothetical protein
MCPWPGTSAAIILGASMSIPPHAGTLSSIRIYIGSTFSLEDHNDDEKDAVMRTVSSVVSGIIDSLKNKTGRYASEEETGEDMRQNMVLMV